MPFPSEKALLLILEFEGMHYKPEWPGAKSGVTIGIGYDLGYCTVDTLESDWETYLPLEHISRLRHVVGLRAESARYRVGALTDIRVRRADAIEVFTERSLPVYTNRARLAFPGFDALHPDVQGALVSLVYNRGTSMIDGPGEQARRNQNRREMREIRDAVAAGDVAAVARHLRSMKRLWEGKNLGGLLRRRDAEANLVESSLS